MKYCVDDPEELPEDELPEDELPEDELPDEDPPVVPDPDPPLTELPPGSVKVAPSVEKTTLPSLSVRYTEMPALVSLDKASEVGCP